MLPLSIAQSNTVDDCKTTFDRMQGTQIGTEAELNARAFWQAKPFPHLIVDNWFDRDAYEDIISKAYGVHSDPAAVFNTGIEQGKTTYDQNSELGKLFKPFVDRLTSKEFMDQLRSEEHTSDSSH